MKQLWDGGVIAHWRWQYALWPLLKGTLTGANVSRGGAIDMVFVFYQQIICNIVFQINYKQMPQWIVFYISVTLKVHKNDQKILSGPSGN